METAYRQQTRKRIQDAQLSQREHAAGCVIVLGVFATSKRLELGDNILRTL